MSRPLFLRIQSAVEAHDRFFVRKRDATGKLGLSSIQKVTAAMRMLAYGMAADTVDEYVRIGESTSIECLKHFVTDVVEIFGAEYLRSPNREDINRLLTLGEQGGFPGMLGSLDCMHWKWKSPVAWKGSHNDINVLDRSPLFTALATGEAPPANYSINGHNYSMGYYLADGIYPPYATFVKTISHPKEIKDKKFSAKQELARKDVERAFGVLQARFHIVCGPARFWDEGILADIMKACIIMHNMIVEDERDENFNYLPDLNFDARREDVQVSREPNERFMQFLQSHQRIRDRETHSQLQCDLVEHLWNREGASRSAEPC